jgi:hypothetical protein
VGLLHSTPPFLSIFSKSHENYCGVTLLFVQLKNPVSCSDLSPVLILYESFLFLFMCVRTSYSLSLVCFSLS